MWLIKTILGFSLVSALLIEVNLFINIKFAAMKAATERTMIAFLMIIFIFQTSPQSMIHISFHYSEAQDVPHFYKWRVPICSSVGEHISRLVETQQRYENVSTQR